MNKRIANTDSKRMSTLHRPLFGTWAAVPFIICMIASMCFSHWVTEYCVIRYSHGDNAWNEGVRLIRSNSRELTDGSQLTVLEGGIRTAAIVLIFLFAYVFWFFVFASLSMKLSKNKHCT
jgi:hypothetical protein